MPLSILARCSLALGVLVSSGASPGGPVPGTPAGAEDDEALVAAWQALAPELRFDVVARFEAEVRALDSFQNRLVARALALEPSDPGFLPEDGELSWFDPKVHARGKGGARRRLDPASSKARRLREAFLARHAPRRLASAWRYDWGSGLVVRTAPLEDPERTLRNGLAGLPPGLDLAEALVERALDDGAERRALAAFGHAYTDRQGNVYPVALYDAWSSGQKLEMPDVDNLGLVHEALGEWDRWVAPVPASQQDALYETVAQLFVRARDHRALRTALARAYLQAEPALRDGYEAQPDLLQALWEQRASDVEALRAELPAAQGVTGFLTAAAQRLQREAEFGAGGARRRAALAADAARVRALLLAILAEARAAPR